MDRPCPRGFSSCPSSDPTNPEYLSSRKRLISISLPQVCVPAFVVNLNDGDFHQELNVVCSLHSRFEQASGKIELVHKAMTWSMPSNIDHTILWAEYEGCIALRKRLNRPTSSLQVYVVQFSLLRWLDPLDENRCRCLSSRRCCEDHAQVRSARVLPKHPRAGNLEILFAMGHILLLCGQHSQRSTCNLQLQATSHNEPCEFQNVVLFDAVDEIL